MRITYLLFSALLMFSCGESSEKSNSTESEIDTESTNEVSRTDEVSNIDAQKDNGSGLPNEENTIVESKKVISDNNSSSKQTPPPYQEDDEDIYADENDHHELPSPMAQPDFSGVYDQILRNFVSNSGKVNYAGIKTNRTLLSQATQYFEENTPESSWSKNKKLAYWINAYNLYTLELVVDNYPVKSIKDIAGGKPWDKKFIKLAGRNLSLNDIENGIIRKDFNEPRIHFAVNCASISCPKLLNKAYTASNLNSLLESQTKRFVNDNSMNSITATNPEISNIFDWYKADFGNVISFLNKYSNTPIEGDAKVSYKTYNWNLNK